MDDHGGIAQMKARLTVTAAMLATALMLMAGAAQAAPTRDATPTATSAAKSCKPIKNKLAKAKRKLRHADGARARKVARKRVTKLKRKLVKCQRPPTLA